MAKENILKEYNSISPSEIDEKESEDDRPLFVEKYIGDFVDGKFHGYGKMIYANKSEYKGIDIHL